MRKHAGGAATTIRVSYQPRVLCLEVENDGCREAAGGGGRAGGPATGHGITGMRERVTAAGGHLEAGPQPGGGFRVSAVLPLPEPAAGPEPVAGFTASAGART